LLLTLGEKLDVEYILNDNSCYDEDQVITHVDQSHTPLLNANTSDDDHVRLSPTLPSLNIMDNVTSAVTPLDHSTYMFTNPEMQETKLSDNFCLFNKIEFQSISLALSNPNSVERHGNPTSMLV
jgi:hypothetical protein